MSRRSPVSRAKNTKSAAWIEAELRALIDTHAIDGITIQQHGGMTRPPKPFYPAQQQLFAHVRDLGSLLGQSIRWAPSGGVCEGNNLLAQGLPGIDTLGVCGGDIHSDREFAWPDSFVERASLSAMILCKLAVGEIDAPALRSRLIVEQAGGASASGLGI